MLKRENYRFGFDILGVALFLAIMIPNFVWFGVPAPNDVLRGESVTPALDGIASAAQVLMTAALCIIVNKDRSRPVPGRWVVGIVGMVLLYYVGWFFYYDGSAGPAVILILCAAPCGAFILFSAVRRNVVSLAFAAVFSVCHVIYGIVNFIV